MRDTRKAVLLCITISTMALTGCSPAHNPTLDRVENKFQTVESEGLVARNAPIAWREAEQGLADAKTAWREDESDQEVAHLAYMAEQKLEIARFKSSAALERDERTSLALTAKDDDLARARMRTEYYQDRVAQLERELQEFKTKRTESGLEITLGQVMFQLDRAALKPGAYRRLEPIAQYMKDEPETSVLIEGHTDSTGTADYNARLSLERANAVRAVLISEGIETGRITTRGLGEAFPVASNETEAGRLQNRRVEVIIQ